MSLGGGILSRLSVRWSLLGTKNLHTSLDEGQMMWETQAGYSLWEVLVAGMQRHLTLQRPEVKVSCLPLLFSVPSETSFLTQPCLLFPLGWVSRKSLIHLSWWPRHCCHRYMTPRGSCVDSGDQNPAPHSYPASASPPEPPPSPLLILSPHS